MFIAAKYMPSKRVTGPFPVSAIDDDVRVRVVKEQGVPITLYENRDGIERYAILAPPGKEMRVVCNGCFKPGMSLFDDRRCQRISSYCQHWDTKGGVRKHICKAEGEDTLEAAELRLQGTVATEPMDELTVDLSTTESRDLVFELLKREEDFKWILPKCDDGLIVTEARNRGIKTIYECHPNDLEAELRRRLDPTRPTVKSFYAKKKSEGRSHCSDAKMVTEEVWGKYFTSCAGLTEEGPPRKRTRGARKTAK